MRIDTAKRIAADEFKAGVTRVWIDTNSLNSVTEAATREDVRQLIDTHVIQIKPKKGNSKGRYRQRLKQIKKGRRRGPGSIRGTKYARFPRKSRWIKTIRALRDELRLLKESGKITGETYRKYYRIIKSGNIKSRSQLRTQLIQNNLMEADVK
ncbi:50S ribosomal protein L19e [Caldiplasma sukawensis]